MSIKKQAAAKLKDLEEIATNGRAYFVHDDDRQFTGCAIITENDLGRQTVIIGISAVNPSDQFSRPLGRLITSRRILSYAFEDKPSDGTRVFDAANGDIVNSLVSDVLNEELDAQKRFVDWVRQICLTEYTSLYAGFKSREG